MTIDKAKISLSAAAALFIAAGGFIVRVEYFFNRMQSDVAEIKKEMWLRSDMSVFEGRLRESNRDIPVAVPNTEEIVRGRIIGAKEGKLHPMKPFFVNGQKQ